MKAAAAIAALAALSFALGVPSSVCLQYERLFSTFGLHHACPAEQLIPSTPSSGYAPWTHTPYCIRSPSSGNQVCVFTDANFFAGQGISIIARPDKADELFGAGLFANSPTGQANTGVKYEAKYKPGRGIGLFVKPGHKYRAGERIMVDYPTLIIPNDVSDPLPPEVDYELQWRAVLQLPERGKARLRSLAKSGKYVDEIESVVRTNSFTQKKADVLHDLVFTEAAVGLRWALLRRTLESHDF
jgi:hypothetical protein